MKQEIMSKIVVGLSLVFIVYLLFASAALKSLKERSAQHVDSAFGNKVLLVVAHPDDETMFFGPTIMKLLERKKKIHIFHMSNGNADKIGFQRQLEARRVAEALGSNVELTVLNDHRLEDGLHWDEEVLYEMIKGQIAKTGVKSVVTFDQYGVSGHTNHRSIHRAIVRLQSELETKLNIYMLHSVCLWRKYLMFMDAPLVYLVNKRRNDTILAIDFVEYSKLRQVLRLHESQMVWYRNLYALFSRYMFINELVPLK